MIEFQDPWENLANAIIIHAVEDYRRSVRHLLKNPDDVDAQLEIQSIERFFRSSWYELLTNLDGEMFIQRLRKEAEKAKKEQKKKPKSNKASQSKGIYYHRRVS